MAEVANSMCDLRATLNGMEHRYRFDSDVLAERLTRQTLFRINALFMAAYNEILELWMPALRTKERNMYGTCEILCRLLREQYPAETPLNLIVWSPADIEALADGMEYAVSEQDTRAVLARMDAIPEEQRLELGVSAGAVMDLIEHVKEAVPAVMVPADLLETLLTTAEQALWHREWTARDSNHPVPEKGRSVRIPAMRVSEWGQVLRTLELKRAFN